MFAKDMVNLSRYPIHDLESSAGQEFAEKCKLEYLQTGLCALPEFVIPGALQLLASEANDFSQDAFFCRNTHNAYLTSDDQNLDAKDVRRRQEETYVGSVAYDLIPETAALRELYLWNPLKNFIAFVLGKKKLHRFSDTLGACSINVFVDGGEHGWHFDESEFTVTLMLQPPISGGLFEYVPMIRGHGDEHAIVQQTLDGQRQRVVQLPFTAGTLLIFGGQKTLHRVTKVTGDKPRLVPVLCFSEDPELKNSDEVRKLFWGRTGEKSESRAS